MGVMYKSGKFYGGINTIDVCPVEHRTLLWTNPDPTVAFAAQTVELDLSEYDEIEVIFVHNVNSDGSNTRELYTRTEVGKNGEAGWVRNDTFLIQRRAYSTSTTGVTFENCVLGSNATVYNNHGLPYQIYGIKRQNTHLELEKIGIHVSSKEPTVNDGQEGDIWLRYGVYNINVTQPENGSITTSRTQGTDGQTVTIAATVNTGYQFYQWVAAAANLSDLTENPVTFTINGSDVDVSATIYAIRTITLTQTEGGTITASASTGIYGDKITLTATPNANYEFTNWTKSSGTISSSTSATATLTMADSDVEISATFTAVEAS